MQTIAGVFDPIKDNRMDWLWEFNPKTNQAYVKENVLDLIEGEFYKYLEKEGWPAPAKEWVLAMGILGGAGSYQWNENSDVDVMVVIDWLRLFQKMKTWSLGQFRKIDLEGQYQYVRKGNRLDGRLVAKKMQQCVIGKGIWQGKGIKHKSVLNQLAPTHPIDYHLVAGFHPKDLRFNNQPPLVDLSLETSYLTDLPVHRRREDEGRSKKDTVWMREIKKPPTGFNLKHHAKDLYQKGLSFLRFATMPWDFLYYADKPNDIIKALDVLKSRYHELYNARTDGYKNWSSGNRKDFEIVVDGETYSHPDWFPANIGIKLLEKTGPTDGKELIKKLIYDQDLKNVDYRNFDSVKKQIRDMIEGNFLAVKDLLKKEAVGQNFKFKESCLQNTINHISNLSTRISLSQKQNVRKASEYSIVEAPYNFFKIDIQNPQMDGFVGFVDFQGLEIDLEVLAGQYREKTNPEGKSWKRYMHHHYGEIRNTEGVDGDLLDAYVGPNHDSSLVIVIHQHRPDDQSFDEDKVMLGFDSVEEAIGAYKKHYPKPGFYREGEFEAFPIGRFWRWVQDGRNKGQKIS